MKISEELKHLKENKNPIILEIFNKRCLDINNFSKNSTYSEYKDCFYTVTYGVIELNKLLCIRIGGRNKYFFNKNKKITLNYLLESSKYSLKLVLKSAISDLIKTKQKIILNDKDINKLINISINIEKQEKL